METALYFLGAGTTIAQFIEVMQKLGETELAKKAITMFNKMKERVSSFIKKPNTKIQELQARMDGLVDAGKKQLEFGSEELEPVLP